MAASRRRGAALGCGTRGMFSAGLGHRDRGPDFVPAVPFAVALAADLWEDVPFIPLGEYWQAAAYRKDLTDVLPGCFAVFYGVRRA
ncbi:MAG TPA: hypothetical protein VHT52_08675 [Stellaceae bacterium]|nr:hypothetical protein [Stellaceae bacterium]